MRAAFIGQRLCTSTSTSPLAALRFAEKLAERPAVTIAADTCHTLSVDREGQVWAWGGHEQGPNEDDDDEEAPALGEGNLPCWLLHLGLGRETGACVTRPERMVLPLGLRVLEVAAGYEHSLLRCSDGHAWSCGVGEHGRLGHLSLHSSSRPMRIESLERVALVAAGGFQVGAQTHTKSMRTHAHAHACAHAHAHAHTHLPTACVCACTSVCSQSLALSDSGVAYSWGWGESGSTGHGERTHATSESDTSAWRPVRRTASAAEPAQCARRRGRCPPPSGRGPRARRRATAL